MTDSREQAYIDKLDEIASSYHQDDDVPDKFIEEMCQQYTLSWIFQQLEDKTCILELGYGDGIISQALAERGCNFEIIEGSPKVIELARANLPDVPITQTLFENFSPDKTYDCVLALHVLEHVDNPVTLFERMKSWLTPKGTIVLIAPNRNSLHRQLAVRMGLQPALDSLSPRDEIVGHQRVYSHDTLRADAEAAGLTVTESTGFFLKPLPNSMMLSFDRRLLRAMNDISPTLPEELLANIGMVVSAR